MSIDSKAVARILYSNAMRKSALLAQRATRRLLAGEVSWIDGDFNRKCVVRAIELAYEKGLRDGCSRTVTVPEPLASCRNPCKMVGGDGIEPPTLSV